MQWNGHEVLILWILQPMESLGEWYNLPMCPTIVHHQKLDLNFVVISYGRFDLSFPKIDASMLSLHQISKAEEEIPTD